MAAFSNGFLCKSTQINIEVDRIIPSGLGEVGLSIILINVQA